MKFIGRILVVSTSDQNQQKEKKIQWENCKKKLDWCYHSKNVLFQFKKVWKIPIFHDFLEYFIWEVNTMARVWLDWLLNNQSFYVWIGIAVMEYSKLFLKWQQWDWILFSIFKSGLLLWQQKILIILRYEKVIKMATGWLDCYHLDWSFLLESTRISMRLLSAEWHKWLLLGDWKPSWPFKDPERKAKTGIHLRKQSFKVTIRIVGSKINSFYLCWKCFNYFFVSFARLETLSVFDQHWHKDKLLIWV